MDNIPTFSIDLIEKLDAIYPNKHPTITMTDREIWIAVGQRQVVDNLIALSKTGDDEDNELPRILNKD